MKEQDLDSSKNEYNEIMSLENAKQINWDMAIDLQKVDNWAQHFLVG